MKTIWDAVNGLKGDLNNSLNCYYRFEDSLFYCYLRCGFGLSYSPHDKGSRYDNVCSVKEFNALVTEMSLGLDVNPVNEGYYHKYLDADKEVLKPIKQQPNIYTQEMYDAGILPSVGMECGWNAHATNIVLTFIGDEMFCGVNDSGKESAGYMDDLRPVTTPTPLIDGEAYEFSIDGFCWVGFCYNGCFFGTRCESELIALASECTNIKPLTVKGE